MSGSGKPWGATRSRRLAAQIRWVARVTSTLGANARPEDLQTAILSALISPEGFGFSRALLFRVDRLSGTLVAKRAAGAGNRSEARLLRKTLREEKRYLDQMVPPPSSSAVAAPRGPSASEALRILRESTHWIGLVQNENPVGPCDGAFLDLRTPLAPVGDAPPTFLQWAAGLKRPALADAESDAPALEPPLAACLQPPAVAIPLRTPKGLHGLILIDRRFEASPAFDEQDIEEVEWFALQAALALENAELIEELETANRQLQELDSLKSNFLSIISHELRTPMTAILGFVDLLMSGRVGELNPNQRALLVRTSKNSNHLLHLLNDLIEVKEVQAEGIQNIRLRPVDPLTVLFNTLPRLEQRRRDRSVEIDPLVRDTIPRIHSDPRSLGRILFHLLDNAIKFSESGKRVEVEFRSRGDVLDIAVRDQGIGIPPDRVRVIFESFYQVDSHLTRHFEGLGLGLTIVRLLLRATQGEIRVESQVGQGSTFILTYPIAKDS